MAMSSSSEASSAASSSTEPVQTAAATGTIPAAGLKGDVAIAAPGAKDHDYIGVWASDAAGCAAIGTPDEKDISVLTLSTYRAGASACYGNFAGGLKDGMASFNMLCTAGTLALGLQQSTPDALVINGRSMVRCKP